MVAEVSLMKLPSDECHWTLLMISHNWFRYWLGAVRQHAITWAKVDPDLCRQMASLGLNELLRGQSLIGFLWNTRRRHPRALRAQYGCHLLVQRLICVLPWPLLCYVLFRVNMDRIMMTLGYTGMHIHSSIELFFIGHETSTWFW